MLTAKGHYCLTWTNSAKHNLATQVPLIATGFPEVTRFYPATVNVRFEPMIVVARPDHRTAPLAWKPIGEDGESGEVFDFVRVGLAFERLGVTAAALLIVSHWSLHRLDPHKHEFLVEHFIDGLADDDAITMTCDRQPIELPYSKVDRAGAGVRAARTLVIA